MPYELLESKEYSSLSHPAKALLFEIMLQYVGTNNGRMLVSRAKLKPRGWRSADVIDRAKKELIEREFIVETVKGHRPNKASWYACTWWTLDRHPEFDSAVVSTFRRGAYRQQENTVLSPPPGQSRPRIGPSHGQVRRPPCPSDVPMKRIGAGTASPSPGHHLD